MRKTTDNLNENSLLNDGLLNDGLLNDGVLTGQVFGEKKITKNKQRCYFCLFPILYLGTSYMFFYLGRYLGNSECINNDGSN